MRLFLWSDSVVSWNSTCIGRLPEEINVIAFLGKPLSSSVRRKGSPYDVLLSALCLK